jgi:hypothetical protein
MPMRMALATKATTSNVGPIQPGPANPSNQQPHYQ